LNDHLAAVRVDEPLGGILGLDLETPVPPGDSMDLRREAMDPGLGGVTALPLPGTRARG
jgi:hypothetical protein